MAQSFDIQGQIEMHNENMAKEGKYYNGEGYPVET